MTNTKGNVIVENIKIGDIHYEYFMGMCSKTIVKTLPVRDEEGYWTWKSEKEDTKEIVNYGVAEGYAHYAPNLYDYEAYPRCKMV